MTEEIKKLIKEQAENYSERIKKNTSLKSNERIAAAAGFTRGAIIISEIILSKQPEMLRYFFIWFRKNGLKYIDLSIEKMIDIYLNENNNG